MKKTITTLLLLTTFFSVRTFGQQTISDLTANAIEAKDNLDAIYDLDVFHYFDLSDYDTELKKSVFKKTQEYQDKLAELKSKKAEMLKTIYYTSLDEGFNSVDYELKRKGFEIELGSNFGMGTMSARTPKSINLPDWRTILLKALPTRQVPQPLFGHGVYTEKLFLPMSEETGLEIENDKENILIYFFFTPNGREKTIFKFYNNTGWYNVTHNDLKADKVRIVVANKSSGKIYFDKNYSYQPTPTAK